MCTDYCIKTFINMQENEIKNVIIIGKTFYATYLNLKQMF